MLSDHDAITMIAVRDLSAAGKFYEGVLGFKKLDSTEEEVLEFASGASKLNVYVSPYAGSNQATTATWNVGNELDAIVARLKARDVAFEHYDMPGLKLEGDVHVGERMKVAWFKDPDGNILSLVSA